MTHAEVIQRADKILRDAGIDKAHVLQTNFLDYADTVRDVVKDWSRDRQNNNAAFLGALKQLRDDFEEIVRKDPACIYVPANPMARGFEQSTAKIRYIHGGNRIAKTQTTAVDNYRVVTRQHPFRPLPPPGGSVFIIGVDFKNYAPAVFETKYVYGEAGNPLSPLFPEGGKWFHHYDNRKHILTVGCVECAEAGKAMQCPGHHIKPVIRLFSDYEKPSSLAGAQYAQGQLDEQIQEGFWAEGLKRLETVPNSGMVVSETPVLGKGFWTYQRLKLFHDELSEAENRVGDTGRPLIEVFSCSQYEGGLVPHAEIEASKQLLTEPQIRARIYGEHVADLESAIFDQAVLFQMRDECIDGQTGTLFVRAEINGGEVMESATSNDRNASALLGRMRGKDRWVNFRADDDGPLHVYAPPTPIDQYLVTADVAKGLTRQDYSSGDVWRIYPEGMDLQMEQVAQWHGWINSSEYGCELMKLASWYNNAPLVVERTGPGDATINKLRELGYWNLYQDLNAPAAARIQYGHLYGVDTQSSTKPVMIALLQACIKDKTTGRRTITIRCLGSIEEMENYVQSPSESGRTITFQAAGTMKDDRVMSAAVGAFVVKTNPGAVYDFNLAQKLRMKREVDTRDWLTQKFWAGLHKQQRAKKIKAERQARYGR